MNIFKWKEFPLEQSEFSIFLESPLLIDQYLFLFPSSLFINSNTSLNIKNLLIKNLFELFKIQKIIIILDFDIIEYNFINNYYITKIFNNNNYIIGFSTKFNLSSFIVTRFQHFHIKNENLNTILKYKNKTFTSNIPSYQFIYMDNYGIDSDLQLYRI